MGVSCDVFEICLCIYLSAYVCTFVSVYHFVSMYLCVDVWADGGVGVCTKMQVHEHVSVVRILCVVCMYIYIVDCKCKGKRHVM